MHDKKTLFFHPHTQLNMNTGLILAVSLITEVPVNSPSMIIFTDIAGRGCYKLL